MKRAEEIIMSFYGMLMIKIHHSEENYIRFDYIDKDINFILSEIEGESGHLIATHNTDVLYSGRCDNFKHNIFRVINFVVNEYSR